MLDLVIDTGVLMIASGIGNRTKGPDETELLDRLRNDIMVYLALDTEDTIRQEYSNKLSHGEFGLQWLGQMAKDGKVILYKRGRLDNGTSTQLKESHFDKDDLNFVRTAMASHCKRIVSEDDDYSKRVKKVLERVSVTVHTVEEICDFIRANQCGDSSV